MSGSELLQYSTSSALDPFFRKGSVGRDVGNTLFAPQGWRTFANFGMRRRFIQPINGTTPSYGGQSTFRYDKSCWQRGPIQAQITRSALAVGGNGTFARFVDYEGYYMIDHVDLTYGANFLYRLKSDNFTLLQLLTKPLRNAYADEHLVNGGKTQSERITLAASPSTMYVDIPFPYTLSPMMYFFGTVIATELQIVVYYAALSSITQTDATNTYPTATITSAQLLSLDLHVMNDERMMGQQLALTQEGINSRIIEWEQQTQLFAAGQTIYTMPLTNIKGAMVEIIAVIRLQSSLTNALPTTGQTYTSFSDYLSWGVTAGGIVIFDTYDKNYSTFYLNAHYHSAWPGALIITGTFAIDPESIVNCTGHKTAASMTNPTLTINFASDPGNIQVDVFTRSNNLWSLNGGEIKRVFQ